MNKWVGTGRITKDAETRYNNEMAISRFTLAVDRKGKDKGTDFISCVAFGKMGEFFEKFGKKGTKFVAEGHIQTGSYEKDGRKVYTTDVVIDSAEFAESKNVSQETVSQKPKVDADGFMELDLEDLPFV